MLVDLMFCSVRAVPCAAGRKIKNPETNYQGFDA